MKNPWLQIPASDYEGHMNSPAVGQQQFLGDVFKESLNKYDSTAIAILGCATGNGLEYIDSNCTHKVTAVDLNPEYLKILSQRYKGDIKGLEILEADLQNCRLENRIYSLISVNLVFEYLEPEALLFKISDWLIHGGIMVAVLQLESEKIARISETSFKSLEALKPIMNLILPDDFKSMAKKQNLQEMEAKTITIESGKTFYIGIYKKI
jgi:ubiquinone/menaquinone biosynthesis C-methylase UbiE